jgi:propionyl-CoA carboxylase alpha chain
MKYSINSGDSGFDIDIDREGIIRIGEEIVEADLQQIAGTTHYSLLLGHRSFELQIEPDEEIYQIRINGVSIPVKVENDRTRLLAGIKSTAVADTHEVVIKSPMPGVIIDLPINQGDQIEAGQLLVVVESMKMHNEFSAPRAGIVKSVRVSQGEKVIQNTILVTIS